MGRRARGLAVGLVVVAGLVAGEGRPLAAQVSPGPLARAHSELEGTLKCTTCHGGGKEAMPARCMACHKDIAWLTDRDRGFHGSKDVKGQSCASCHPDHAGQDFQLIKWPDGSRDRFDHRRTGWPLLQRHADAPCDECHAARFMASPAAKLSARKSPGGWTGLEPTCTSCHEDIHRGALNHDCTACHDAGKWTVTPGFSHDTTGYPLTNKHALVACDKCHLAQRLAPKSDGRGHLIPVYKPVPHQACSDCHQDVHKGQFGTDCTRCHSTLGWKSLDKGKFDHDKTRYPLRGQHASVRCAACHHDFSTPESKRPAFQPCGACHQDVHKGTATLAGKSFDCAECHDVNGFTPSTLPVDRHRVTRYPLEGKHATVKCAGCHVKDRSPQGVTQWGTARVVMRPAFARCVDCHADDHGGQLASRPDRGDCEGCHRVAGWTPSTFDSAAHARVRLALDGRHLTIECRACHGSDRKGLPPLPKVTLGKAGFFFKVSEAECTACHVDPHRGRFEAGGAVPIPGGCRACHDTRGFRPSAVDVAAHSHFAFPLEGAHRATPCGECHREMKGTPGPRRSSLVRAAANSTSELRFDTKRGCADCHQSPHGSQFDHRKDHGRCEGCHDVVAFSPASRFDHDRDALFSLKGAHEHVPCTQCHQVDSRGGATKMVIYQPLSTKCESCHGRNSK